MIPDEAVEAACDALPIDSYVAGLDTVRTMLEAAIPHLTHLQKVATMNPSTEAIEFASRRLAEGSGLTGEQAHDAVHDVLASLQVYEEARK